MTAVSPTTTPVPWSSITPWPMRAAGWMSAPVTSEMRFCRNSARVLRSSRHSQWVMRWHWMAWKPLKYSSGVE